MLSTSFNTQKESVTAKRQGGLAGASQTVPEQKSGFQSPKIELPKGGGAIRGMGEKFAANPVTGTGAMSVPLATSPGRSGFEPQLSLSYDSGTGNGPFGFGWSLSIPQISRKTDKGLPLYLDAVESDTFLLSGAEDLVPLLKPDGSRQKYHEGDYTVHPYRPRIEGLFARIERWTRQDGDVHWRSISADNILNLYGLSNNARLADPAEPGHIFSWLLCESRDDKGNAILYEYKTEDGTGLSLAQAHQRNRGALEASARKANRYLKHIRYGNQLSLLDDRGKRPRLLTQEQIGAAGWMFQVVFDWGEHDAKNPKPGDAGAWYYRSDAFSSYRPGFEMRTCRLCQRVLLFHHFPDEPGIGQNCLVKSTDFTYTPAPDDRRQAGYTFLQAVTQRGYKRHNGTYLKQSFPPLEFEYSKPLVQETVEELDSTSLENLPQGLDGAFYQWTDLHGEGIPGILSEQAGAWFYKRNISPMQGDKVCFAPLEQVAIKPNLTLAGGAQLMDLAGDGLPDLVLLDGPMAGLFEHDGQEGWQEFRPFLSRLNCNSQDPNLRLIDLDGDGHADVLITEEDAFLWHPSMAEQGFGPAQRIAQHLDEEKGPRLVFADGSQSIFLADLSGDGLTDLMRIRNGEICYWPNLGRGKFGAKISMDSAPLFDQPEQFDYRRIRLADIDGSGTTDLIYLHREGVRLYFNQSGNSWSDPNPLPALPAADELTSFQVADLLGNGTACLVWSSPLPANEQQQMRYLNLMGSQKPHLLIKIINNLGAETHIQYVPSTKFYLQDKWAGKPWITRLPFPVHVIERIDTYDHISRNRFTTRYAYHHGYFDGLEREFRGFGMVEQWDSEWMAALTGNDQMPEASNLQTAFQLPPVHTKTWFHTGAYFMRTELTRQYQKEYFREPHLTDAAYFEQLLSNTTLPPGLNLAEEKEAYRAFKGLMLRQEVYADDALADSSEAQLQRAKTPYTVLEQSFGLRLLQPRSGNRDAVLLPFPLEVINYHYERNPADPRIQHKLMLETDPFGNVLKEASIAYGRRQPDDNLPLQADRDKQTQTLITYTENRLTQHIDNFELHPHDYRQPLPCESRTYELSGYLPTGPAGRFRDSDLVVPNPGDPDQLMHLFEEEISYEAEATSGKQRRLIEQLRSLYRKDNLSDLLPLGELEPLALAGEQYQLAFCPGLLAKVFKREGESLLSDPTEVLGGAGADMGGYADLDGNGQWWVPSGQIFLSPVTSHTPSQETDYARSHFFLPHRFRTPFHTNTLSTESLVQWDKYKLMVVQTEDALGNIISIGERLPDGTHDPGKPGWDYRVLQPMRMMDQNRNCTQLAFDTLGMLVGKAFMGKPEESLGDSLEGFQADLPEAVLMEHISNPLRDPHSILGGASSRLLYDLFAYQRSKDRPNPQPVVVYGLQRETHQSDLEAEQESKIQHSYSYSDGFGREIQQKLQAEAGPLVEGGPDINPRWVGSGWTIFNNKGNPVRQYEPFFSPTPQFEFGVVAGVSAILFYDPLERVLAKLHPNQSWEKVVINPWQQSLWDVNDTCLRLPNTDLDISAFVAGYFQSQPAGWQSWHAQRQAGGMGPEEQMAALKTAAHADTPTDHYFDALGRDFLTQTHNKVLCANHPFHGTESMQYTRLEFDLEGNLRTVRDATIQNGDKRGRIVMRYDYDMLGNLIQQQSMEAGASWMLQDSSGNPIRSWDERGHHFRIQYDPLRRPLRTFVTGANPAQPDHELLTERQIWGEQHPEAEQRNLRGQRYLQLDQAGTMSTETIDYKGNTIQTSRRLALEYKQSLNWQAVDAVMPADARAVLHPATLETALGPLLEPETYTSITTYDALNRIHSIHTPHSPGMQANLIRPTYNEANLLERVEANLRGESVANVLVWTTFVTNIDYNARGQRQRIQYGNGISTRYAYDPLTFRLRQLQTRRGGEQMQHLSYTYDPSGNITAISDEAQQEIFFRNQLIEPGNVYTYDALYQLIEAQGREHLGQVAGIPAPNSYNDSPRVGIDWSANDGKAMGNYLERYLYDQAGNFLELQHLGSHPSQAAWKRTFEYEEASLMEADKQSNRLSRCRLSNGSTSTEPLAYDRQGNLTQLPHLSNNPAKPNLHWNYSNQLIQADLGGGGTAYFTYDAAGQRVRKVWEKPGGLTDEHFYLGGFEIYRRKQGSERLEKESLHIIDGEQRIALVETRTIDTSGTHPGPARLIRYQLNNHLGSSSLELDHQAHIISYEEYYPFGNTSYQAVRSQMETHKRYRYSGKERDEGTGLYYFGARYYAPWLARWISPDPIGIRDALNLYGYTANNPVKFIDPDGQEIVISYQDGKNTKTLTYKYEKNRKLDEKAPDFLKNTLKSLDYLVEKKAMEIKIGVGKNAKSVDTLDAIIKDKKNKVTISDGTLSGKNDYDSTTNTIRFQHNKAIRFRKDSTKETSNENLGRNSPAGLLAHELLHAYNDLYDSKEYLKRKEDKSTNKNDGISFPNKEEEYVTKDLANQVLKKLGEDSRNHYGTRYFTVDDPTANRKNPVIKPNTEEVPKPVEKEKKPPISPKKPEKGAFNMIPGLRRPDPHLWSGLDTRYRRAGVL